MTKFFFKGQAEVLQQFLINVGKKKIPVAGCKCTRGVLKKNALCKIIRSGKVLYNGKIFILIFYGYFCLANFNN